MLKKTIEFTDVDGNRTSETHYFNLTTADLVKMQLREGEGFQDYINRIVESGDGQAIIDTFEKILRLAYGVRSADGKFTKPAGAFDEFMAGEAYSELFMELVTNGSKSAEFISAVVPNDLAERVKKVQDEVGIPQNLQAQKDVVPESRDEFGLSDAELLAAMGVTDEELKTGGLTDVQIKLLSPSQLKDQPREVLLRAYQLRNK